MASLKFIMDVNDDQTDPRHTINKRDKDPVLANTDQLHEAPANSQSYPRYASSSDRAVDYQDINQASPSSAQTKTRGTSSTRTHKPTAASASSISSSSSSLPTITTSTSTRHPARRRSTASNDSMDHTRYGSAASPSSMGGNLHPSNSPMRPMPHNPAGSDIPMRLTPITGRVSRAKKGVPVHVCNQCTPAKTFTRAEHLRRHQLSHQPAQYPCTYPNCDRAFHRLDLLTRHQQRHEQEGDNRSTGGRDRSAPEPSAPLPIDPVFHTTPNRLSPAGSSAGMSSMTGTVSSPVPGTLSPPPTVSMAGYQHSVTGYPPSTRSRQPGPIFVNTEGLGVPDLYNTNISPWPSSASDSAYSTPVSASDVPRQTVWTDARNSMLSPYPNPPQQREEMPTMHTPPPAYYYPPTETHYTSAPPPYGNSMFEVPFTGFETRPIMGHSSEGMFPLSHGDSISSVRSPTPHLNTSSYTTETLVAPSSAIPNRVGPIARLGRKGIMSSDAHRDLIGAQRVMGSVGVLGGLGIGLETGTETSPGGDNGNEGSGVLAAEALGLPMDSGCGLTGVVSLARLPRPLQAAIPGYISLYWERVHSIFPVVHRASFEAHPEEALRCAMAAMATQYLNSKEDRIRGSQLHEYAWQEAKRTSQWTVQTMQAILLCEYFGRFRGRKLVTRPSKCFESLYSRVMYDNPAMYDHAMASADQHMTVQDRWHSWLDAEARRRLLAACFCVDGHSSIYQQQPRAQNPQLKGSHIPPIPLLGPSEDLWEATTAEEWAARLEARPEAGIPVFANQVGLFTSEDLLRQAPFDRRTFLSAEMLRLPRRQLRATMTSHLASSPTTDVVDASTQYVGSQFDSDQQHPHNQAQLFGSAQDTLSLDAEERINVLFRGCPVANTYLALQHTPLQDLLAVAGDSWVFSKKVMPATTFTEQKKRLKYWAEQHQQRSSNAHGSGNGGNMPSSTAGLEELSSAQATIYASRAIVGFFESYVNPGPVPCSYHDLSDYWALYVCALICWAFGYRQRANPNASSSSEQMQRKGNEGYSITTRSQMSSNLQGNNSTPAQNADEEALAWLLRVANAPLASTSDLGNSNNNQNGRYHHSNQLNSNDSSNGTRLEDIVRTPAAATRSKNGGQPGYSSMRPRNGGEQQPSFGNSVVSLVRRRIEADCIGQRARLFVDAVGVLKKLEEGTNWKWF